MVYLLHFGHSHQQAFVLVNKEATEGERLFKVLDAVFFGHKILHLAPFGTVAAATVSH